MRSLNEIIAINEKAQADFEASEKRKSSFFAIHGPGGKKVVRSFETRSEAEAFARQVGKLSGCAIRVEQLTAA
jgi:hypothetical protein